MTDADLAELGRDELVALILKQAAAIAALEAKVEELTRSAKRQAAPFSKGLRRPAAHAARPRARAGDVQGPRGAGPRAVLRAADRGPRRAAGLPGLRRRAGLRPRRGGLDHRPPRGRQAARPALPRGRPSL